MGHFLARESFPCPRSNSSNGGIGRSEIQKVRHYDSRIQISKQKGVFEHSVKATVRSSPSIRCSGQHSPNILPYLMQNSPKDYILIVIILNFAEFCLSGVSAFGAVSKGSPRASFSVEP